MGTETDSSIQNCLNLDGRPPEQLRLSELQQRYSQWTTNTSIEDEQSSRKPFFQECWDTIVYSFTATANVFKTDPLEEKVAAVSYSEVRENILKAFHNVDSKTKQQKRPERSPPDCYTVILDASTSHPVHTKVTFVSIPLRPNLVVPAKFYRPFHNNCTDYFKNEPNAFIKGYGVIKGVIEEELRYLQLAKVRRELTEEEGKDETDDSPLVPSKAYIADFYHDTITSGYDIFCGNRRFTAAVKLFGEHDILPKTKMKFELPRISEAQSYKSTQTRDSVYSPTGVENEDDIKAFENLIVNKFLTRLVYLAAVVKFLNQEVQAFDLFRRRFIIHVVVFIIFALNLYFEILAGLSLQKSGFQSFELHVTGIAALIFSVGFQFVLLYVWITEGLKRTSFTLINNVGIKVAEIIRAMKSVSHIRETSNLTIVTTLMVITSSILIAKDMMKKNKNPLPLIVSFLMILLAAGFSKSRRHIPWRTVSVMFSTSYIMFTIFSTHSLSSASMVASRSLTHIMMHISSFLPKLFPLKSFPIVFHWINRMLVASFIIEVIKYSDLHKMVMSIAKPVAMVLSITWIELSYVITGISMTFLNIVKMNTNMTRLLTQSELCLLFAVCFNNYHLVFALAFEVLGIPLTSYLITISSYPVSVAFAKILYPEMHRSVVSGRSVFTRHSPVTSFTRLITDVWISSIAHGMHFLAMICLSVSTCTVLFDLIVYVLNNITGMNAETLPIMLSPFIRPLIWACGVSDRDEGQRLAEIFLSRLLINNFKATQLLGASLSRTWLEDCRSLKNLLFYGIDNANGTHILNAFVDKTALSHRTLFMALPLALTKGSLGFFALITTGFISLRPCHQTKRVIATAVRAFVSSLFTTFFSCIIIGYVIDEDIDRIACMSSHIGEYRDDQVFCEAYVNGLDQLAKERAHKEDNIHRFRLFSETLCFKLAIEQN